MKPTLAAVAILLACTNTPAAPPGRLVDVGDGRRMHLVCEGSGGPTVVFESGLGEGWYVWALVQPALAQSYRTCSYDRAGIGFSDPRGGERTVAVLNSDLHELLRRAGEKPPFLLVGHSLGGIFLRRYAARYPEDVAGMVLVDSASEDFDSKFPPLPEEQEAVRAAREKRRQQIAGWRADGKWPEMEFDRKVPSELQRLLRPRSASAAWWDARFAESALPDINDAQPRLDRPLIVITATEWPRLPWRTPERHAAWAQARLEIQKELASRSSQSRHILVSTSHSVQLERPQVVIDAVREVARLSR